MSGRVVIPPVAVCDSATSCQPFRIVDSAVMLRAHFLSFILLACCGGVCGCSGTADVAVMKDFERAEKKFSAAKTPSEYLEAAIAYQSILDRGFRSGIVLYNQGNAFMNANQRGRAIAAYRQAQRLRPGDPLVEANLQTALAGVAVPHQKPLMETLLFWQNWIGYSTKFLVATGLLLLTAVCGFLAVVPAPITCELLSLHDLAFSSSCVGWSEFSDCRLKRS